KPAPLPARIGWLPILVGQAILRFRSGFPLRDRSGFKCAKKQIGGTCMAIPESVDMNAARLRRIEPAMQSYVDRGIYAGVSTIIARRGVVVHAAQYGLRDKEAGTPMTEDTIFRLYSMTKPVVSTALMMLLEEGRFRLIDPVARYVPAFASLK